MTIGFAKRTGKGLPICLPPPDNAPMSDAEDDPLPFLFPAGEGAFEPFLLLKGDEHGCLKVEKTGYYFNPPCDPECCPAFGPFEDMVAAREWARTFPWKLSHHIDQPICAGIGSPCMPKAILELMAQIGEALVADGWVLRRGGALDADSALEHGWVGAEDDPDFSPPWPAYTDRQPGNSPITEEMVRVAAKYHPDWDTLSEQSKSEIARMGTIVMGRHFMDRATLVICWTPDGQAIGHTGQALRIAADKNVPVINLGAPGAGDLSLDDILSRARALAAAAVKEY